MTSKEDLEQKRRSQTNELYCEIGRFIVCFELINFTIQHSITMIIDCFGLKKQSITYCLIAGYTARQLIDLFVSLINEIYELSAKDRLIFDHICSRFIKLIEKRNEIIHSTWFIGWGNETTEDYSEASAFRNHKSKKGADLQSFRRKAEDFKSLSTEAESLRMLFMGLETCILLPIPFSKYFSLEKGQIITNNA